MYIIFILIYQFTAKSFTEFIPNYPKDNLIQQQLNDEKAKNQRLEEEIKKLKSEIKHLKENKK